MSYKSVKLDKVRRLNRERANAALLADAMATTNVPIGDPEAALKVEMKARLIQDAWLKAELAYREAVNDLSHSEMLELIHGEKSVESEQPKLQDFGSTLFSNFG